VSYETTEARWAARDAEQAWKRHRGGCPVCSMAAGKRRWAELCEVGVVQLLAHRQAEAELTRNRQLDRQPTPGQGTFL
jgi:hypothetical protein